MEPESFTVPVAGGDLFVARWGEGPVVVAAHGITSNHAAFLEVAHHLDGAVTLLAPDLRGRGASGHLPGPYGMAAHAGDLVAVLDHVGAGSAVIAGHSMGAYVATVLAARHPDRVSGLVLLDGGLSRTLPDGVDPDVVLEQVLGPAQERLGMTFPSVAEYLDFWRPHPAFAESWSDDLERYFRWDLGGEVPELRSRVSAAAVREDGRDVLLGPDPARALDAITCPVTLLRAPRGLFDEPAPFHPDDLVAAHAHRIPGLVDEVVPGTNHYTLVMGPGSAIVAARIREAAGR